ncbi:MAG: TIM barrel protein [Phycisphaerales bacterium]|nr:TIM barrel protein [Phycisphaerales bacterium]
MRDFPRRAFLAWSLTGVAGAGLAAAAAQRSRQPHTAPTPAAPPKVEIAKPLFEISLAQWSLHRALYAGTLDHLDFASTAKKAYGISAVEYVNTFFKDKATDAKYLSQMNQRAADAGVKSLLIMIDAEGAIGDPDEAKRTQTIESHCKWLDAAKTLGCHSIRVNAQSEGAPDEQLRLAADGLRRLTEHAEKLSINVLVENHGGLSSKGSWLAAVMKKVNHPRCGTLPDFGNFRISDTETYDRYTGVAELMPFAKAVSAKSHEFNDQGDEVHTDFRKMLKIVLDAGYRGHIGVEYEGDKHTEPDGIRLTKSLLEKVRAELDVAPR